MHGCFFVAFSLEINITSIMKTNTREAVCPSGQENMPWSLGPVPSVPASPGDLLICIIYITVASGDLRTRAGWGHYCGMNHNKKIRLAFLGNKIQKKNEINIL